MPIRSPLYTATYARQPSAARASAAWTARAGSLSGLSVRRRMALSSERTAPAAADPVLGAITLGERAFAGQLRDLAEGVGRGAFGVGAQQIEEAIFASGRHRLGRGDVRPA